MVLVWLNLALDYFFNTWSFLHMNTEQLQPTTLIPNNRMVMTRWWGGGCPCTLRNLHNMRLFGIDLVGSSCSQYEYELQIQTNVQVVSWLSMHNFPHGLVSFADGFNVDPLRFLIIIKIFQRRLYRNHLNSQSLTIYSKLSSSKLVQA